jgi:hypothetical protein
MLRHVAAELTPAQKVRMDALCYIPPSTGVGAEEIKAARDLVNKLAQRELEGRYLRGRAWNNPDPKEAAELRRARARLAVLEGALPEWAGVVTKEKIRGGSFDASRLWRWCLEFLKKLVAKNRN